MDQKQTTRSPVISIRHQSNRTIWAIGGGKGGTGKTFVSANLAVYLSQRNKEITLIDADLGGANLHTFLGLRKSDIDIGDFLTKKVPTLKDVAIPTPYNKLRLVKGSDNLLFTANLNYFKKLKLIRHIKTFDSDVIIIDIGTGSTYNSVDFFLLSNPGILVINPEPTSIENAYYFLKSCIIRLLKLYIDHYKIQDLIKKVTKQLKDNSRSVYSFLSEIISQDKYYADLLYRALKKFRPSLIINKARHEKDFMLGESISNVVQKILVIDLNYLGAIPFSEKVHKSVTGLTPFILEHPESDVGEAISSIASQLISIDNTHHEDKKL
ncbi:MAG: P-loop NTPase [Candidatus Aminicenantes bacterium]|nr:P-loop NTPase [Candidatus Aminicenantes bacterium]